MEVEVRLFATFREGRFKKRQMEFPNGSLLGDLLADLTIPTEQVGILLVNGHNASAGYTLAANDVVSIFPSIGGG